MIKWLLEFLGLHRWYLTLWTHPDGYRFPMATGVNNVKNLMRFKFTTDANARDVVTSELKFLYTNLAAELFTILRISRAEYNAVKRELLSAGGKTNGEPVR